MLTYCRKWSSSHSFLRQPFYLLLLTNNNREVTTAAAICIQPMVTNNASNEIKWVINPPRPKATPVAICDCPVERPHAYESRFSSRFFAYNASQAGVPMASARSSPASTTPWSSRRPKRKLRHQAWPNSSSCASALASRSLRLSPSPSRTRRKFSRTVSVRKIDGSCGR